MPLFSKITEHSRNLPASRSPQRRLARLPPHLAEQAIIAMITYNFSKPATFNQELSLSRYNIEGWGKALNYAT
jgi:hypothetical protein